MFCHWLNFLPCFLAVLHCYSVFHGHFCHLEGKISPKHIWGRIYPSRQQKDLNGGSIFMCLQWLNFVSSVLAVLGLSLWFLDVFLSFGGIMAPNTHIVPYLSFLMTKLPGRLIIFYILPMTKSCYLFPDSFCTIIMLSTGISVLWRQNCLSKDKTTCLNTYWAASILPINKISWETDTFWCSSHYWTLCLDFQHCLDCYCSFTCIPPICMEKHAPKHIWAISTLPDKINTWEMSHFWCTSNYTTLCIIPCNVWKVIKVSIGTSWLLFM